ncbi:hypothetical protein ACU8KH_00784 [Lachancea thermotolerans]
MSWYKKPRPGCEWHRGASKKSFNDFHLSLVAAQWGSAHGRDRTFKNSVYRARQPGPTVLKLFVRRTEPVLHEVTTNAIETLFALLSEVYGFVPLEQHASGICFFQ